MLKIRAGEITNPYTIGSIYQEIMQYTQEGLAEAGQTAFIDPDTTNFSDEALIAVARRSQWVKTDTPPTINTAQQARDYFRWVRDTIYTIADQKELTIQKYDQIKAGLNSNENEADFHNQLGIFVPYVMQLCMFYNPEDDGDRISIINALNRYCPKVMEVIQEKTSVAQSRFMSALLNWGKQAGRMVNECEWLVSWATGWAKYDPIGAVEDETARSIDDYTKNPARVPLLETQSAINRHGHDFIYELMNNLFRGSSLSIPDQIESINSAASALNELANTYGNGSASSSTSEQIDADTLFSKTQKQHDRDTVKMQKVQFTSDRAANRFAPFKPVDPNKLAQFMETHSAEMVQRMLLKQVYKDAPQPLSRRANNVQFPTQAQRK